MKTISPESFAMICFLVLMQNHEGLKDKSPDYIEEKTPMLGAGYNAFSYLDRGNMQKAVEWCVRWKMDVPEVIRTEMAAQDAAALRLLAMGFDL